MTTFSTLGLNDQIVRAVTELGFETPTEIQQKAIPIFLQRASDLVALAQTGTGKTASFGLPIIQNIDATKKSIQALIIAPTRELCIQITNDLKNYSKYCGGIRITAVYGGSSIMAQVRELKMGTHIVVATPGRLIDLLDRKALKIDFIETVVLDEADEMLNMGFQEDIETILSLTPETKITGLFSATMPSEIRKIANKYLKASEEVSVGRKNSSSADISHQYAVVHAKEKFQALKRIIDFNEDFFGIVFCTTRIETQEISDALVKHGYNADCLHGDLSQQQRDKVMGKFRKRVVKILCATDVAARGIDVNDITHVIHYHLPDDIENYTHRSGRTARAGKKGISIALLHTREAYKLHQIEKMANMKFEKFLIPQGDEIIAKRVQQFVAEFVEMDYKATSKLEAKNEWIFPLMQLDKEELVARIMAREFSKLDTNYVEHGDLNVDERGSKERRGTRETEGRFDRRGSRGNDRGGSSAGDVKLTINLGKKDNIRYDEMRELIFRQTKVSGHHIKDIDMQGAFSSFMTDSQSASRIIENMKNFSHQGRSIFVQQGDKGSSATRSGGGNFKTKKFGSGSKPGGASKQRSRKGDMSW